MASQSATDEATDVVIADHNNGLVVLRHAPWSLVVTVPNTPVVWPIGTPQTISRESHLPTGSVVKIAISRDGGVSWTPIASGVPDTGSYPWTVTGPASSQVRIRVGWLTVRPCGSRWTDVSDVDFTIASALWARPRPGR